MLRGRLSRRFSLKSGCGGFSAVFPDSRRGTARCHSGGEGPGARPYTPGVRPARTSKTSTKSNSKAKKTTGCKKASSRAKAEGQQAELPTESEQASQPGESGEAEKNGDSRRLVILDGHGIIFRAYFAVREPLVIRRTAEVTTAVFGFANTLLHVINELEPTHIALAMDPPGKTFRDEADATYKAHRAPMPDDLPPQIERCRQVAAAFSIPIYEVPGYEADDTLATLADQAAEAGVETWIATLDSDLLQLVRPRISVFMYRPYQRDTVRYDSAEKVRDRYGIDPPQVIDFKGLKGDTSDNIPGVPGIGEKTAVKLLNEYPDMEAVYDHLDDVTPTRAQNALRENRDLAFHSKMMATIAHDVPVELDIEAATVTDFDRTAVLDLFSELEFRSLIGRIPDQEAPEGAVVSAAEAGEYDSVRTLPALEGWLKRARKAPLLAVDLETSDRDTMSCEIVGFALADAEGKAAYIPVGHADDGMPQLDHDEVLAALTPVLEDASIAKTGHNLKFDIKVLARHGVTLRGLTHDSMVAAYLLGESSVGLKTLALEKLGIEMMPISDLIGSGRNQKSMAEVEAKDASPYGASDADVALRLAVLFEQQFEDEPALRSLYETMELPLIPVLAEIERTGVSLDPTAFEDLEANLGAAIETAERQTYEAVGHEFNIGSPKQLSEVLFEELDLPKTRKTTQGYTTDAQSLERLSEAHPAVDLVLQWRELTKLQSTYVQTLPELVNTATGRIHTDYNQTVAATGRLSSENPNLQNIPVRTEMGRRIRAAFVPRALAEAEGEEIRFLSADYSQIELRVLAHLSRDEGLIEAFNNDEDIHAATASAVNEIGIGEVGEDMRRVAKMMNFGVIYGLTAHGLAQRTGMSHADAQAFIDAYFERFPRVHEWIEEIKRSTAESGYAETLMGRRRYLPDIKSANFQVRSAAERMAINMPVQGTGADVMKMAMLQVQEALGERDLFSRMILQVHDELIFELPEAEAEEVSGLLHEIMPSAIEMVVPLKIDVKLGDNWRDLAPYEAGVPA